MIVRVKKDGKDFAFDFEEKRLVNVSVNDGGSPEDGDAWWRDLSPNDERFPRELLLAMNISWDACK
jgi:hypothetical protein